uniref:PUM-HD domain-containing protein n=1 Tax=Kalanchoe fedtschenkoi TaxID=63787 RepID=A0A7N0UAX3_KALFE
MAISIAEASEASEFFSGEEALMRSFDNLQLGSDQKKGVKDQSAADIHVKNEMGFCEDDDLCDGYLQNPIWGFQHEEFTGNFNGGMCRWRRRNEAHGFSDGGNLSSLKEYSNPGLIVNSENLAYPLLSSSTYNSKNSSVDNLWEWHTQEECSSPSSSTSLVSNPIRWSSECSLRSTARKSPGSKDSFLDDGSLDFYSGGWGSCPVSMWNFAAEMGKPCQGVTDQCPKCNEVVYIASTKEGSHYLQRVLAVGDEEVVSVIYGGVYASVFAVMMNQHGQHLLHKTFDVCSMVQQEKLVLKMASDESALVLAAKNQHGSYFLQRLVKKLKGLPFINLIASSLASDMKSLMISQYGKHVILQCFIHLDSQKCQTLYEALIGCCIEVATDVVGCTSLNNSINNMTGECRDRLLSNLIENSAFLSQDPSGNFVLQYILSLRNPTLSKNICYHLQGQYIQLSMHKSGSHLVEKCLKSSGVEYVINDLLANQKQLLQLARDQFGNYVLQTSLRVTEFHSGKMHQFLLQALDPHVPNFKCHPIGRNVFNVISSCIQWPKHRREKSSPVRHAPAAKKCSEDFRAFAGVGV